jgi:hypothetical protein
MNASTAKIIGIVLIVLLAVGFLRFLVLAPLGIATGIFHFRGHDFFDHGGLWVWPFAGFAGFFGLLYLAFIIWLLFWVYRDAESRGMSGALWAIVVFFLHLLGLVVYLLVRSGYPVKEKRPSAGPAPAPTAPPAPSATAPPGTPAPPAPSAPSASAPLSCRKCGNALQSGWVACPHCGERVS